MVKNVEEKDIYNHEHGMRVRNYSLKIAEILGFSSERLENIIFAALCHDVGKVFVPNEVEARIIALADSFDAMTSDRSYRKAMDVEVAFKELKSLSGIHYDKKVVEAFEKVLREENKI